MNAAPRGANSEGGTGRTPTTGQSKSKTFDAEEERKRRIGGKKNNFNTEEPEKKDARTQEAALKICAKKTKKFEVCNKAKESQPRMKIFKDRWVTDSNRCLWLWAEQIPPCYSRAEENARSLYARSE